LTYIWSVLVHLCRSLIRFWGVALLNIAGLSIAFSAAIIIGLYIRNELTFDHFIPEARDVYVLTTAYGPANAPSVLNDKAPPGMAKWLLTDTQAIKSVARLYPTEWPVKTPRREALEHFYWADPNIFEFLKLKAVVGDLSTALDRPDSVVLTQGMARRYFGSEDVLGKTLYLANSSPVHVTAVLADLPANTNLDREIFVSGKTGYSMLSLFDQNPNWQWASCYLYVRLNPGAVIQPRELETIAARHWQNPYNLPAAFYLIPLLDLHFSPEADSQMRPRGHKDTIAAMAAVAALILILAAVNFAGLMTAQIDERRDEMVIRKALGAGRLDLMLQVLGEAAILTLPAIVLSLALVERVLPIINIHLGLDLSLWSSPLLVAGVIVFAAVIEILGAFYPAVKLSAIATGDDVTRRLEVQSRSYLSRVGWVTVQFALLITLLISAQTVYQQWLFATTRALNFDGSNVLLINLMNADGKDLSVKRAALALEAVDGAAYSRFIPIEQDIRPGWFTNTKGQLVQFTRQSVDSDFFSLYRVRVLAGSGFSGIYTEDVPPREIIINRSAIAAFGFKDATDALNRKITYQADNKPVTSTIIGVVEDMRLTSVRKPLRPMVFDNQAKFFSRLSIKLNGKATLDTLRHIDQIWARNNPTAGPIERHFYSEYLDNQYRDMIQQSWVFALLSCVGICLSILGISGLSIYLARTRRRELAIRNALGAQRWDLFMLRIMPFIKPLVFGNIIGWVLAWCLMTWWLDSFDAHIHLTLIAFASSTMLTIVIAFATTIAHSFLTQPVRSSQSLRAE
jgi:putative ABC transport system permease protein